MCDIKVPFRDCFDEVEHKGQQCLPFECQLPTWLPPSTMLSNAKDKALMCIRYEIRAQLIPVEDKDWADKA